MSVSAESLQQLHRIHQQLSDVKERLSRGPKQVALAEGNLSRFKEAVENAKIAHLEARKASDAKQLQMKENEAKIENLKGKLNAANSNREYQALNDEIAADEMANSVLADEILESFEKIDELANTVKEEESHLQTAQGEVDKVRKRVSEEQQGLESELARLQDELQSAEEKLPADFREDYNRVTRLKGEDALAEVEGRECCGGCYYMITPQQLNDLLMSRPVFCRSCGRLLYVPEDRSV